MPEISAVTPSPNEPGLGADQLLDTLPWGLLEVSATGIIRHLNRQAAAWWGVLVEDALGQTIEQVGPGQLPAPAYTTLQRAASSPTKAAECYLPQPEQWVTLISTEQPTGELVVYWQDITPQKQREQQYQTLAENTPDVLTRWDPALRLLYANAAFAAKAGQPLSALLGYTFADMGLPAEVAGPYQAVLQQVFDTGQPQTYYNVFPSPYGPIQYYSRLVPELRDGHVETVLGIARDISELKRTEAETLRLREALSQQATDRYQALLYAMDEGFCVLELTFDDSGQQVVDYVYRELNPVFARQSGLPAEALGQSVLELVPDLEPIWFDIYGRVARTGEPIRLEHQVPQLGRWFELHACRVGGPGSQQVAVLFNDITARKHTETTLRRAAEANTFRLQLADALGSLTAAVSIQEAVTHLARLHFGADRCCYCEIMGGQALIRRDAAAAGLPSVAGTYPLADFALLQAVIAAGQPFSVPDVRQDDTVDENLRQLCVQLQVISYLNVPVIKNGAAVGVLCLVQSAPRQWAATDVDLAAEVAERIWVAGERARVEAALRDSEARLQLAVDATDLGTFVWHVAEDRTEEDARARVHFGLAPGSTVPLAEALVTTFHPDDAPRYAAAVAHATDPAGPGTLHEEFRVRHPDGQQRWLAVTATATFAGTPRAAIRLTGVLADITARKQQQQQQQFLLRLSDALRPLADAVAIQQAALQLVGELLRLDRVLYNEIDPNVTTYTVRASYTREGFLAYGGQQPMGPFTESVRALQRGITKVVYDVETDESFSAEERAICASIQVRAFVVVPLVKDGQWLINLVAHASQPRSWPAHEVALLEETAERTWAAVERATVAEALHNSEAQLHSFVTASSNSLYRMDADWQHMQTMQGKGFLAPTEAPNATWLTQYIPPAAQPAVQAAIQAAIAGRHFFELEHHVLRADGSIGWTFSRAVPVLGPQGELVEWFGTATDITARKLAEAARRESEERLQTLVENLPGAAVFVVDADLRYLVAEGDALHQAGLRPGDLLGRTVREALPPALWALHEAHYRAALAGQPFALEHEAHGRAFATRGVPLRHAAGQAPTVLAVSYDITERKQAEDALRASEAQLVEFNAQLERQVARRTQALQESQLLLQSVYDTTLVGLAVLHAVRDEATGAIIDFTFISTNKELARLIGRPSLVGRRYGPEFPGREASGVLALMAQAVETGQPQQSEFSYSVAGDPRWVAFMCVKLDGGVVASLLDITVRKTAEQQRIRNLYLLEQAETVAQLGSWDYELATRQFYWSGGMYNLFGLPLGEPVQPPIYLDYVLPEDRSQAEQLVRHIMTGAGDFETTLRLQVGEVVKTVRIKSVVLRDAQGQAVRVLGVDLDLSELHRLEADNLRLRLRQQQALFEAVQAAEEEERRRMSESLHNGIGQILYATKLQLDSLPDAPKLSPQRRADELLGEAIRQTRALSHELTPAILEQYGLEKTLRSICRTLNTPGLHWHCYLVFEAARPLPMPLQLAVYRLAQELAQNVLKHAQATEATLEVEVLPAWLVLRVEDNGRGFDPAQASDGLGLRSLRSRVALLGGSVHLTTIPAQGTQCQIRLPLATLAS